MHKFIVLVAALGCAALARVPLSAPAPSEDVTAALRRTSALQQTARVLRNGATAGAGAQVLGAQAATLREDLDALVEAHHRWAASIPEARRSAAVAAELASIEDGCARMRASLDELDRILRAASVDRAAVQSVGQRVGRQARLCAQSIRRAQRG